jgi:rare lipoprotein A
MHQQGARDLKTNPSQPVPPSRRLAVFFCLLVLVSLTACGSSPKTAAGAVGFKESGMASYYGKEYQGRKTSNGEKFDNGKKTAAHRTLPFGAMVKVTNTDNHKSVVVRVNDRGPFVKGRIIDLSSSAFSQIASINAGVAPVKIEVID